MPDIKFIILAQYVDLPANFYIFYWQFIDWFLHLIYFTSLYLYYRVCLFGKK